MVSATSTSSPAPGVIAAPATPVAPRRPKGFWYFFGRNRAAVLALGVIVVLCLVGIFAGQIAPRDPAEQELRDRLAPPGSAYLLGADQFGRDVLSRMIHGTTISLAVAAVAVTLTISLGTLLGSLAGYYGGWLDMVIMRFVDIIMSMPNLFLLIAIVAIFGPSLMMTMFVIGMTNWMSTARLVRGQFLQVRAQEFVQAARAAGASDFRIMVQHLLPNTMHVIIVQASLFTSLAILIEASLSFLGLGAQPPTPSWGNMLSEGRNFMRTGWWVATFPGMAIFITALSFNLLGDGLRDALDPRMRGR